MSDGAHLLIPHAAALDPGCRAALPSLRLANLERLLARLEPDGTDEGDERTLSMPHERVLAKACGVAAGDGRHPLAALELHQAGGGPGTNAWAWITPCHWRVGRDHIVMDDPARLQLDAQEALAVMDAMRPWLAQDGIELRAHAPTRWLASGNLFADLPCASLDRVVGRVLDPWMPRGETGRALRRLQQEMQMLLYTHPSSEARIAAGQLPVNSFWVSGAGALPPDVPSGACAGLEVAPGLRDPAIQGDWAAWTAAWQALDAGPVAHLLQAHQRGDTVTLTLCGERSARRWRSAPKRSLLQRWAGSMRRVVLADTLDTL